ncbi:MAG: rhodanese-like domain-containing protein [Thermomicrobiales bacterium]
MYRNTSAPGLLPLEVDVAHVASVLDDPDVQIVDCREPNEWQAAHIDGTRLMPLDTLAFRKKELDPARPVVVVCRSGQRSLLAAEMLTASGFTDARSMAGGLIAWVEAGKPVVR